MKINFFIIWFNWINIMIMKNLHLGQKAFTIIHLGQKTLLLTI